MKNLKTLLASLFAILMTFNVATAQEEEPTFTVSGSIDTYARYNFSDEQLQAPGTSFAQLPGFSLGMANVILSYEGEKVGFVADFVYGPRGSEAVFGSAGSASIVNQLYAYINVSESLTLTMGNFNTFLGYEVISPVGNFNYSTSYMFSYGPFSHTGIKADIALSDDWSLMVGLMNPTDITEFNPLDQYMFGAQLGFYGQYLNLLTGMGYTQIDYTGGFDISDTFFLGINATTASTSDSDLGFSGVALYPQLELSDSFSLGLRGEFFSEKEDFTGVFVASEADNFSLTITGSAEVGGLTIKPEFRIDSASEEIFFGSENAASANLASFLVAAIYSF